MVPRKRLILVTGQEGAGKTTIVRALLPHTPLGAQIDAEDVGQVNPWAMDDAFIELLWSNVASLVHNFWTAGFANVIAGSFLENHDDFLRFRPRVAEDASMQLARQLLLTMCGRLCEAEARSRERH